VRQSDIELQQHSPRVVSRAGMSDPMCTVVC